VGKIILLNDIYEVRKRKEQELAFYHDQLEKLKQKMFFIQKDIDITNLCIEIIENEKVVDIKELVEKKK
tara:strand:- start:23 stop:229 length:207 start_codon:yes stop_codon:yes gene_type:complete